MSGKEDKPVANNKTINIEQIVSAGLTRQGKAMYVYWLPPGPEMEHPDEQISLSFASRTGAELVNPVLIDPLDARVSQIDRVQRNGDKLLIPNAPLADHPLIITDRSVALG